VLQNDGGVPDVESSMTKRNLCYLRIAVLLGLLGTAHACGAARLPAPVDDIAATSSEPRSAVFAGGDFATVEAVFRHVRGVTGTVAGYAGGTAATADFTMVDRGRTGHAESVEVTFDPQQVSYGRLLQVFFSVAHDPTEVDRQGPDAGRQFRSVIFTTAPEQARVATAYIAQLDAAKAFARPIATQVLPLPAFYPGEGRFQNYAAQNRAQPYVARYTLPRLAQLREEFPDLYIGD
jgi:peptide-methionine (S)-S-oxide reductase